MAGASLGVAVLLGQGGVGVGGQGLTCCGQTEGPVPSLRSASLCLVEQQFRSGPRGGVADVSCSVTHVVIETNRWFRGEGARPV